MILIGNGVSPGIAVGKIHIHGKFHIEPEKGFCAGGEERSQILHYETVKQLAIDELEKIRLNIEKLDSEKAGIFKAHQDIADDIVINEEIHNKILKEHWNAEWAVYKVYDTFLQMVRNAPDPLIAQRASDFEDVCNRILRIMLGIKDDMLSKINEPVIIAACDLLPSDTASMDKVKILAILTETGGATSHSAIIAKSYGIPAVLGINGLMETVKQGQLVTVNAIDGTVNTEPDNTYIKEHILKRDTFLSSKELTEAFRNREGRTKDNVKIDIDINITSAAKQELDAEKYVDSVGLFRTEFLYMGRDTLPSEKEQLNHYKKVLECFKNRPVVLRTVDIGGDKVLSSLDLPKEENPFMGNRAIRFCFNYPDIFKTQIRAALRASVYGNLWLMLPMISSLEDIRKAKDFINSVREELKNEGKPFGEIKTGIIIEIPSIALIVNQAVKEVDFASIGTNDLCQYLCAADRMNSAVETYYQSYHPAMFTVINNVIKTFNKAGKPISVCGEMASDPLVTPVLIGFGIRKLSMGAAAVPVIKRALSDFTVKQAEQIAKKVLKFSTASEVEKYLTRQIAPALI
ncbi:MAG: phosphoenolpyruvate--protein phosphotransferase [Treponema sp.]|nr:phosphoenolpyruvate--protein phosphotransferase [Treponema sp.]